MHLVRCKQRYPNVFLIPLGQVGNCGKTYFGAYCGEEDMLADKEAINR
jgi:hypothetical protein